MNQELTGQQQARVFAQYLECRCRIYSDTDPVDGVLRSAGLNKLSIYIGPWYNLAQAHPDNTKLLLRPLSAITDEDAIEVANMVLHKSALSAANGLNWLTLAARNYVADDGHQYGPIPWDVHQFLIQRGYAVPLFIAPGHPSNGKTAIELGLAIETTNP